MRPDLNNLRKIEENIYSSLSSDGGSPYDSKAKVYEFLIGTFLYNKLMWGTTPANYADFARKAVKNCRGEILDIGCGGLSQTARVYSQIPNNLMLLDNSVEMLRIGKKRISDELGKIPENIKFIHANAFELPFENESVENIVSFGMIHLFDNKQEYINSIFRVLKPGGNFYFSSLTSDRDFSKKYIRFLQKRNEFGEAMSSGETLTLISENAGNFEHYMSGSMIFIYGRK